MSITLSSRDRNTTTSISRSDFQLKLNSPIYASMFSLVGASIPNTIYNVRTGINDTFVVGLTGDASTDYTATLPAGNYTIDDVVAALPTLIGTATGKTHGMAYNDVTLKTTVTGSTGMYVKSTGTLNSCLGFSTTANSATGTSVTASNATNFNEPAYVFVRLMASPGFIPNGVQLPASQNFATFKIYFKADRANVGFYTPEDLLNQEISLQNGVQEFRDFRIQLVYADGTLVDLNGFDWDLTLEYA